MPFTYATISMDWNVSSVKFRDPNTNKVTTKTTAELDADTTLRDYLLDLCLTATPVATTYKENYNKSSGVVQAVEGGAYDGTNTIKYDETTIYQSLTKAGV